MIDAHAANELPRWLLSVAAVGYGLVAISADVRKTNRSAEGWTRGQALHLFWHIVAYAGVSVLTLFLIWADGQLYVERFYLAACFASHVYAAFLITALPAGLFEGKNATAPAPEKPKRPLWRDPSVIAFVALTLMLISSVLLVTVPDDGFRHDWAESD